MNNTYTHRCAFVFFCFLAPYGALIINLYLIQILDSHFFISLGEKQYQSIMTHTYPRAIIYDRHKQPLVLNQQGLAAIILPSKLIAPEKVTQFLKHHFPYAYDTFLKKPHAHFMYIKRKLSEEQINNIKNAHIDDIKFLEEASRFYPFPSLAPIIGITDIDNQGLFGIEQKYNAALMGIPTQFYLLKDARSGHFYFEKKIKQEGCMGKDITLSLDSTLQFLAYEELKKTVHEFNAQEGSVLIMNPTTGEILVMANIPHCDPNDQQHLNIALTKNNIIANAHESGSVFKIFSALAAIDENVVTIDEMIDCKGTKTTYLDGFKVNTWKAHNIIPFKEVIAHSNNIGIATVAKRLGKRLHYHYTQLGFGKKTGIELPGEAKGYLNPPEKWSKQSIISLSFGYEVSATLLQIACAFGLIANNGHAVTPTILYQPTPIIGEKKYSAESIATIKEILQYDTMKRAAKLAKLANGTIMGKTGTANLVIDGKYDKNENIFTYAGIVEKNDYKRVVVVFIKASNPNKLYASSVGTPLFERVVQKMIIHEKII